MSNLQDADFVAGASVLWAKKCPRAAGINPFLGENGGDRNHSTLLNGALQHFFVLGSADALVLSMVRYSRYLQ